MKLAEHLADLLCDRADHDESIFVLDGDLADSDGADRFAERHPERFLMAGIAEQNLIGVAAGLASTQWKPWAFSFAAFLVYRAYDQIRVSVAQSLQPVVLVGSHAGALAARNGKSHATLNDIALTATLPHVEVFAPADRADLEWLVPDLTLRPRAAYVRLPRADIDALAPLGGSAGPVRLLAAPAARTIVSTGLATHWAAALVRSLAARGTQIGLIHVAQLKPLPDLERMLEDVETIITLEDHVVLGGLGSLMQDRFPERHVRKFGWPVNFAGASGSDDDIRRAHALDLSSLTDALSSPDIERNFAC
ncbi:hypothetical protein [Luteibacter sp. dw_328]|uniref:transketolase family protein n=1 Tax=Luteibacter sp. dw_328 TaxID=2719796 RepID=UPI001BD58EF0|nr:hypothetical protein [Luteibacter sp. dw_328]